MFCVRVDNRGMGDVFFPSNLFTTLSTYMNTENCCHNYKYPLDPKFACEETTKNVIYLKLPLFRYGSLIVMFSFPKAVFEISGFGDWCKHRPQFSPNS